MSIIFWMTRARWAEDGFSAHFTAWRRWTTASAFGVGVFGRGCALGGLSLRSPERENAALRENAAQR
jgi:hypothetical protein